VRRSIGFLVFAFALAALAQARAATGDVQDRAAMFGADTISRVNAIDAQLVRRTGRSVTVVSVTALRGTPMQDAAAREAARRHLKGVLIYAARDPKLVSIVYDSSTQTLFAPALQTSVEQALRTSFQAGDFDTGLVTAVSAIADVIAGGASGGHGPAPQQVRAAQQRGPAGGMDVSWLWWVLGFLAVCAIAWAVFTRRTQKGAGIVGSGS
jgi:uncharacterized membrane protein YgcG